MNKRNNALSLNKISLYGVLVLCVGIVLLPLAAENSLPDLMDYIRHLDHIVEAGRAVSSGQYVLRVSDAGRHGWLYPLFQFYSPTGYLIAGSLYHWFFPKSPFLVYKITVGLFLWLGSSYLYRLAFKLTSSQWCAYAAALIYLFSPYTLIVVDHIGGFNEALAIGVVPVVIFYSLLWWEQESNFIVALKLILAWYVLITTHLLTFLLTVVSLGCWLGIATILRREGFKRLGMSVLLLMGGMGLAAWYLIPILQFNALLMIHKTFESYAVFESTLPGWQTLFSPIALYANVSAQTTIYFVAIVQAALGSVMVFSFVLATYSLITRAINLRFPHGLFVSLYVTVMILFLLMYSPLPFWRYLPPQALVIQYSWRLLGPLTWMSALLFALSTARFIKTSLNIKTGLCLSLLIILPSVSWLHAERKMPVDEAMLNNLPALLEQKSIVEDYLLDVKKSVSHIHFIDSIVLMKPTAVDSIERIHLSLSSHLLQSAASPFVRLQAFLQGVSVKHSVQLNAFLNTDKIASYTLTTETLDWIIPLSSWQARSGELHFTLQSLSAVPSSVFRPLIEKVVLGGFLSPQTVQTVAEVSKHCQKGGQVSECEVQGTPELQWLELPLLYYPGMLQVRLNGRLVPYYGVLYEDSLVTAIKVGPHPVNKITFAFVGSPGGNYLSFSVAALLFLIAFYLYLRKVFYPVPTLR